jgi:FkbM family methyltransferase
MSVLRSLAKKTAVLFLGSDSKPRRIVGGLPSGYLINVSPSDNLGYLIGTAERHLQRIIREHVSAGDTVFDIGANIGFVTLSLAKQVGVKGRVTAFEPIPENAQALRENLQNNRIVNVQVLETAASEQSGDAVIRLTENHSTASLIWHKKDPTAKEVHIKTVVIDDLVDRGELGRPTFVKIDVEGAEGLVLNGMRRTLAAARPAVFIECSESGRATTWAILRELGYRCQSAITGEEIAQFERYRHSDFLWVPSRLS